MNLRQIVRIAGIVCNLVGLGIALATEAPAREAVGVILALAGTFIVLEAEGIAAMLRRI
ncbi:MAG: hypothetical protein K2X91_04145 [Thermoleophilia bacterium]|nr:hypothetical protein [Thermoleophilia bacterium]